MKDQYISIKNLSLEYPIFQYGAFSIKSFIVSRLKGIQQKTTFEALKNISLEARSGDRIGLIGSNGAGKTTLLKVMSKILFPTSGIIHTKGHITSFLNIGLGVQEELSGIENVKIFGMLHGLSKKQIDKAMDDVCAFSELGDALHYPFKTYSAGMKTRLLYGMATSFKPDILLLDEMIGVGDFSFIQKAEKRLENFLKNTGILVLASHSDDIIRKFCTKAIFLEKGQIVYFGDVEEALDKYHSQSK